MGVLETLLHEASKPLRIFCFESIAVSQFTYLYYALKVCTLFVKKKYILLSM